MYSFIIQKPTSLILYLFVIITAVANFYRPQHDTFQNKDIGKQCHFQLPPQRNTQCMRLRPITHLTHINHTLVPCLTVSIVRRCPLTFWSHTPCQIKLTPKFSARTKFNPLINVIHNLDYLLDDVSCTFY